jgi:hypothetical protein
MTPKRKRGIIDLAGFGESDQARSAAQSPPLLQGYGTVSCAARQLPRADGCASRAEHLGAGARRLLCRCVLPRCAPIRARQDREVLRMERCCPEAKDKDLFWPILLKLWHRFDAIAAHDCFWQDRLVELMERQPALSAQEHLSERSKSFFCGLPKTITVYRSFGMGYSPGISWTTDLSTAALYAVRATVLGGAPAIATGKIFKRDRRLYFVTQDRNEYEVVCRPTLVNIKEHSVDSLCEIAPRK